MDARSGLARWWPVLASVVLSLVLVHGSCTAAQEPAGKRKVHPCSGAGRWFPADAEKLGRTVDAFLSLPEPAVPRQPIALVCPHAGYQYCGAVAGKAYATLKGYPYRRVILLGPSHQAQVRGASVLRVEAYKTPLGSIRVDAEARDALLECSIVTEQPAAHQNEHSVENQLPMLQRVLKDFKMVEVLVGNLKPEERATLAAAVRDLVNEETLLVVSTDFCHFGPRFGHVPFREHVRDSLKALNDRAVEKIVQVDVAGWDTFLRETGDTICGRDAVGLLLEILEPWDDVQGRRVAYNTSGDVTGDWSNSVTYAAVVFWQMTGGLTRAEQRTLLRLARDTVAFYVKNGKAPQVDEVKYDLTAALKAPGAAFVTLENKGRLRGCIGHVVAVKPLYLSVIENACRACEDPRFKADPVTEAEVPQLSIEISCLTPMRRLADPKEVQVGRDGLMMVRGWRRGLLLPQVPTEQGWNREEFLTYACRKAGLPPDAWKEPETQVYRFGAQVFGEGGEGE
ncbi:MAG: AmmeMemoRadiSam system protein B [Phycisphaerae bacterium]